MSLYQDERGFIWIGTRNGLNLFDGVNIRVFKANEDGKNTHQNNCISKIDGDNEGNLYIQNYSGIDCLNIQTEQIQPIIKTTANSMFVSENNEMYYSKGNQLYCYNHNKHTFVYQLPISDNINSLFVTSDLILLGTLKHGLYIWNKKNKTTEHFLDSILIHNIYKDQKGIYWIGTRQKGYFKYHNNTISKGQRLGKDNSVRAFCEDKYHNMWIGTMNGLYRLHPDGIQYDLYQANHSLSSISHNSVWALLRDRQDNIWIGTYFGGVDFFNSEMQFIKHYSDNSNETHLNNAVVGKMQEDSNHNLWICTDGGGLNCLNLKTGKITYITTNNGLSHNNVRTLFVGPNHNRLYVGMYMGGLDCIDLQTNKIEHCLSEKDRSLTINDIIQWNDDLLLATHEGIIRYNLQTKKYYPLYKKGTQQKIDVGTSFIFIDSKERLWLAGNNLGCSSYNLKNEETKFYFRSNDKKKRLSNVNYVFEDSQNRIWFCTSESGLQQLDEINDTSQTISFLQDKSISSCAFCICEISNDEYLVETDNGFYIFNNKNQQIINYSNRKRFPLISMFQPSLAKTSNGDIYLGGINGLIAFNPATIKKTGKEYNLFPSRLWVNGQEITPNDESQILTKTISYTQNIKLKSKQTNFAIEYGITDFVPTHQKELEYQLDGYSDKWHSITNKYRIEFNNLNPGNYVLNVRFRGTTEISSLKIKILPPFYKTIWAYIIYLMITVIIILFLLRIQHRHIRLQEQLKFEQERINYIENTNQAKLRFFTNISHEIRTPLTVIIGYAQSLLNLHQLPDEATYKLQGLNKACFQLKNLIDELLDFRKQEQNHIQLHVCRIDAVQFLTESLTLFSDYAQEKGILFNILTPTEPLYLWIDPKQMFKVINNLVSNALKHTSKGQSIVVSLEQHDQSAVIEVKDTGIGIKANEINKIFNRFYQTDISSVGTGIGLALTKGIIEEHHGFIEVKSVEGIGSTFIITLPLGNEHYSAEELKPIERALNTEQEEVKEYLSALQPDIHRKQSFNKNKELPTIVIVEDNEQLLDMLIQLFNKKYNVIAAEDGEEGWELIQQKMPDLILTDVVMPQKNGIELCKLVKDTFDTCHIPVIMLTARASIDQNLEGLAIGADDYITKPVNTELLLMRCHNIIQNRKILQEKFATQPDMEISALTVNSKEQEFIEKVCSFIRSNLSNNNLNVDDIANELCISRTKFFTKLKNITGQTPHNFLISIRLKEAARLLREQPDMNITEIAIEAGFSSSRYFSKCFKDAMGIIPIEYRKSES